MLFEADKEMSLIDNSNPIDPRPLADRLRPETLADYIGQQHLMAADKPLGGLANKGQIHSMILWGPPGTGKTTLAKILATSAGCQWISISAVLSGVKDIRLAVEQAEYYLTQGEKTVLFVDEVHRFNKSQQDAFLPHVEKGTITFIGATTENPSFEVNAALLSRARVYVLRGLLHDDLVQVVQRGAQALGVEVSAEAERLLIDCVDGDARRCLNILEIACQLNDGMVTEETIVAASGERIRRFDKGGDLFYEQISALHKSIRGSSPDAAIYWFCRMLDGGADPRYIGRRLIRLASEDVGNADPRALELTLAAVSSYERLGKPEGELALAQAVLYLASVPKSDAAYKAFAAAKAFVAQSPTLDVPMHLRNAATGMMKNMGYGEGYRHAHSETSASGAYAAGEDYFPEAMHPQQFYFPQSSGLEDKIRSRLERLRELDNQAPEKRRDET
jgi:putative ATPase